MNLSAIKLLTNYTLLLEIVTESGRHTQKSVHSRQRYEQTM
jgi:hypothetical protein